MLTAVKPQAQVLAYVPRVYTFKVVLRDRFDQENLYIVKTDSDRLCNVLPVIRAQYPGQSLVDCWEVPA